MATPEQIRTPLLWLVGLRVGLGLAALAAAPFLYREHALGLILMRPTKEVLLFGGFLVRKGDISLPLVVLAAVPFLVGGVWLFYALGRSFSDEIETGELPGLAGRLVPPDKVNQLRELLERKGWRVVFLGRLAAFPSAMIAAAAGASDMPTRTFLLADGAGAAASLVEVVGAGYLLGQAYKSAGPWITVVGVVVLAGMAIALGRYLKRD